MTGTAVGRKPGRWVPRRGALALVLAAGTACSGKIASSGMGGSPDDGASQEGGGAGGGGGGAGGGGGGPVGDCTPTGGAMLDLTPGNKTGLTLTVGGTARHYALQVPKGYDPKVCHPLLLFLHGTAADPSPVDVEKHYILYGKWQGTADANGFLVALPVGGKVGANYAWSNAGEPTFINALVDHLVANGGVDQKRVYIVGFSSGGNYVVDAISRDSARYGAFGVHGSGLQDTFKKPPRKGGVFIFVGANDEYGWMKEAGALRSALKTNGWVEGDDLLYTEKPGWTHEYDPSTNAAQWTFFSKFAVP